MTGDGSPHWSGDLSSRSHGEFGSATGRRPLTIALVNTMPDAALQATERQFCTLLAAASTGLLVHLKFYTLPGVRRSEIVQAHIGSFYEDFRSLDHDPPDGLIMTGAVPEAASLSEEAFWPHMANIINLCHDRGIPGVWSCLAAHAAVFEIDRIPRLRLPQKLSGAFDCRINSAKHQIFHDMPGRWRVPHSRLNGLRRIDLERRGYDVVSGSSETGVDMFIKRYECIQLYLQGHPEYDSGTLAEEFRRDTLRAFRTRPSTMPDLPMGLGLRQNSEAARKLQMAVAEGDEPKMQACLETVLGQMKPKHAWAVHTRTLFANWLAYVDARKHRMRDGIAIHA